jgi:hypothetical protein
MSKVCYWNSETQSQEVRDMTPEELAQQAIDIAAAAVPAVAESVPMLNLQLVLIEDGKLGAVESLLAGMAGDDGARARAYWAKALTARRDNYLVDMIWPALGYDAAGFDAAWARAAALNP